MADRRSDAELVSAARGGNREAFGELVARYKDAVFGVAFHRLGNFEEARDAAQDAILKALENLNKLREPSAFGNWLYRIADGVALDATRHRSREIAYSEMESTTARAPAADDADMAQQVREALAILSEPSRLAVILHYVNGYSHTEVAQFLGTTPGAVKTRINRAKVWLREEMAEMVATRLKKESAIFMFEATDDSGRLITGQTDARSAAAVRKRLTEKGYHVIKVRRDRRTTDEREEDDQEPITRVANVILEQALKYNASTIRIAFDRRGAIVRVGYRIAEIWHEVMVSPDYIWEPLRKKLSEMGGVELREEGARQRGVIAFKFEGKAREFKVISGKRVIRMRL